MKNNIQGKIIVITGASSGMGASAARHLANEGAAVVLGARRKDRIEALAEEIKKNGGKAMAKATDVTKQEELQSLVGLTVENFGKVDVIINNAGIISVAGHKMWPNSSVYGATKYAVRALSEGLRQEVKPYNIRTTIVSPGSVETELLNHISDKEIAKSIHKRTDEYALPPDSFARIVAFAINQPAEVDINEVLFRSVYQSV